MRNLLLLFLVFSFISIDAQIPAFPGAEGGGMYTTGGRGGKVLVVTSLVDDGSVGTFRWAVTQSGTRTVVFKVSGLITLQSRLSINNPNLTIAGQTAPGDGICLKDYDLTVNADNIIIRYIRVRLGNNIIANESDAIGGRYKNNIILDHCSFSWSIDECASFYANENFTMQWCFITESLNNAGHSKGAHGYGGLWGGKNASFHHNLLAHHNSRNPRFNGWKRSGLSYNNPMDEERLDFRNNVIYNWGDNSSYGGETDGKYNIVANYFKYGPATKSTIKSKITQVDIDTSSAYGQRFGTYYITDNYVYENSSVTQNNWNGGVTYASGVNTTLCKTSTPFANIPMTQHTAETAFDKVLSYGGCSKLRDAVDARNVSEAQNGTATHKGSITNRPGILDTQADVGGWPTYNSATGPTDSDGDGMPDDWEISNGLNPNFASDGNLTTLDGIYTNLEVYMNGLVKNITDAQLSDAISGTKVVNTDKFSIFPNPYQKGNLNFNSNDNITKICLYSINGMLINEVKANSNQLSVSYDNLQSGLYILKVQTENGITVPKILIKE